MTTTGGTSFLKRAILRAGGMIAAVLLVTSPASAQDDDATRTTRILVRGVTLHPRTAREMDRTLSRLSEAAMQACGAEPFGYGENRAAIAASPCWHDAMNAATVRIEQPTSRMARAGGP